MMMLSEVNMSAGEAVYIHEDSSCHPDGRTRPNGMTIAVRTSTAPENRAATGFLLYMLHSRISPRKMVAHLYSRIMEVAVHIQPFIEMLPE